MNARFLALCLLTLPALGATATLATRLHPADYALQPPASSTSMARTSREPFPASSGMDSAPGLYVYLDAGARPLNLDAAGRPRLATVAERFRARQRYFLTLGAGGSVAHPATGALCSFPENYDARLDPEMAPLAAR